jgi:hypothetical protein
VAAARVPPAREIAGPGTDTVAQYVGVGPSLPLAAVLLAWNALLWGFAALGAVSGLRSRHRAFWAFVVATIAYVMLVLAGAAAYARLRTPIVPLLALLAAMGVKVCVSRLRRSARTRKT